MFKFSLMLSLIFSGLNLVLLISPYFSYYNTIVLYLLAKKSTKSFINWCTKLFLQFFDICEKTGQWYWLLNFCSLTIVSFGIILRLFLYQSIFFNFDYLIDNIFTLILLLLICSNTFFRFFLNIGRMSINIVFNLIPGKIYLPKKR